MSATSGIGTASLMAGISRTASPIGDRDAQDVAAGRIQLLGLPDIAFDIPGRDAQHRLDGNRGAPAYLEVSRAQRAAVAAGDPGRSLHDCILLILCLSGGFTVLNGTASKCR